MARLPELLSNQLSVGALASMMLRVDSFAILLDLSALSTALADNDTGLSAEDVDAVLSNARATTMVLSILSESLTTTPVGIDTGLPRLRSMFYPFLFDAFFRMVSARTVMQYAACHAGDVL